MAVKIGPKHGGARINGTRHDDTLTARGYHNTIYGNGGNDSVNGGRGFADVVFGSKGDGQTMLTDTVSLAGMGNTVTAGDENILVSGNIRSSSFTLGNGNDVFNVDGADNRIEILAGSDIISALGGHAHIEFGGTAAQDDFGTENITVGGAGNYVQEDIAAKDGGLGYGTTNITGGSGHGTFGISGGTLNIVTGGFNNIISGGNGTIVAGSGFDTIGDYSTSCTIILDGHGNKVDAFSSGVSVSGGDGNGNFTLTGFYNDPQTANFVMLDTGGLHNYVAVTDATINATCGGGDDTVSATASSGTIAFAGTGDILSIDGGLDMTVMDGSKGLDIAFGQAIPTELTIDNFDRTGLIDFGTFTSYTSVGQILSALQETSPGEYTLAVPAQSSSGTINFHDAGKLTANNFRVGGH